jgi:hypothetical protein
MKKRLDSIFLSFGIGLFLCTIVGREVTLLAHHSVGYGAPLWLLLPSFLLISIGGELKNARHKTKAELVPIFFAPESVYPSTGDKKFRHSSVS